MRPLAELPDAAARALRGVIFDLDDTVLDHGALTEGAYSALFRLKESGLTLIACTGRPAGWGELVQRQWPVDFTLAENGAIAFSGGARWGPEGTPDRAAPIIRLDPVPPEVRGARRARLSHLADALVARFPEVERADDNPARITDVTLDIGEHRSVPADVVDAMVAHVSSEGVRTFRSSVHFHLTFDAADKASGALGLLARELGEDPTTARTRYAFVGDSENDAGAFAAFRWSFGVANVKQIAARLTVRPRFVARAERGAGFREIAAQLVAARARRG